MMTADDLSRRMWAEAVDMLQRAERLHRQFFRPSVATMPVASWEPPVDVFETDRAYWVLAALPGVEPESVEIAHEASELLVTGQRRLPAFAREAAILRLEIPHGRFERRIRLPTPHLSVEQSELAQGCLLIRLSKRR
jgi:HSP20 family molecular chaperone IbpA